MIDSLARNVSLYPWYQAATSVLPWLPVFFLYFNSYVSLDGAIKLGALYYLAVVVCEIPSGYLSDRVGRRPTLMLSAVFLLLSYLTFIFADGFALLAIAEVLLAAGIAFQSGSDTSLLYDSLLALDREPEYAAREAQAQQYSLLALSLSCFIGGWLGTIDLVYPYIAALIAAAVSFAITLMFVEPATLHGKSTNGFTSQLVVSLNYLKDPMLRWILFFFILAYALSHIAYEFYQPYIKLLDTDLLNNLIHGDNASMLSGIVIGVSMFGGALGAKASIALLARLGLTRLLVTCTFIQSLIIGAMSLLLHPLILLGVMVRNFPMATTHGPMLGAIGPRIASSQRATYLSIQSLFGRLAVSAVLYLLSQLTGDKQALEWNALSAILLISAVGGLICVVVLAITGHKLEPDTDKSVA